MHWGMLKALGIDALYYLAQYGDIEWHVRNHDNDQSMWVSECDDWIQNGISAFEIFGTFKALSKIVNNFNNNWPIIMNSPAVKDKCTYTDPNTGLKVWRKYDINLPSGGSWVTIDFGKLAAFQIPDEVYSWKGFCIPIFQLSSGISGVRFRFNQFGRFEFNIPGTEHFTYNINGYEDKGLNFNPVKKMNYEDFDYFFSLFNWVYIIIDFLNAIGLASITGNLLTNISSIIWYDEEYNQDYKNSVLFKEGLTDMEQVGQDDTDILNILNKYVVGKYHGAY